jgi:hypothetical protein
MYVIGDLRQNPVSEIVSLAFLTFQIVVTKIYKKIKTWHEKLDVQVSPKNCLLPFNKSISMPRG